MLKYLSKTSSKLMPLRHYWFNNSKIKALSVVFIAGFLSACSTTPRAIDFEEQNRSFTQVAQSPDAFAGSQVRWGGIVARVENLEKDTLVEIVNLPLDYRARPLANQQTGGRFIARIQGFLDPMIYKQGKEITVVGILSRAMPGMIGEHKVDFPVVDSSGHHLWQQRPSHQNVMVYSSWDPFWFSNVGYRWHYPYYSRPYFAPMYPRYRPIRYYNNNHYSAPTRAAPSPTNVSRPRPQQTQRQPSTSQAVRKPVVPSRPTRINPRTENWKIKTSKPRPHQKIK